MVSLLDHPFLRLRRETGDEDAPADEPTAADEGAEDVATQVWENIFTCCLFINVLDDVEKCFREF